MAKRIQQMIDEQVHYWKMNHPIEDKLQHKGQKLPIITISREFGAGGLEIASHLEEMIGFKKWDKELLDVISERLGQKKEYLESLDETRLNAIEDAIFGFMNHKSTNLNYLIYLVRAIQAIEKHGNAIIVGRGANFICQDKTTFNVRIVAPQAARVNHIAKKEGLTREQARNLVQKKEIERKDFTRRNFNHDTSSPVEYDLVINSATIGIKNACMLIIKGYELKLGHTINVLQFHEPQSLNYSKIEENPG